MKYILPLLLVLTLAGTAQADGLFELERCSPATLIDKLEWYAHWPLHKGEFWQVLDPPTSVTWLYRCWSVTGRPYNQALVDAIVEALKAKETP